MSIKKSLLFWLIFITFFTLIPLILLELSGRTYIYFKYGVPEKTYGLWRYDEVLGAQHRENAYNTNAETNNFGFRNTENIIQPKPDGSFRIITYGGSTTFCYNLLNDETWPAQLQNLLRKERNGNDQVLNAGAILWSLGHAYARAKKDIPVLKPDYVIIYSGINETTNASFLSIQGKDMQGLISKKHFGEFAKNYDQNRWAKRNLFIIRVLDYIIKPLLTEQKPKLKNRTNIQNVISEENKIQLNPFILDNYLHTLEEFINLIKNNGGQPVFVIQAQGNNSESNLHLTHYSISGTEVAKEHGAIIVDARKLVNSYRGDPMDLFYYTGAHYSKLGANQLAKLIFDDVFATD